MKNCATLYQLAAIIGDEGRIVTANEGRFTFAFAQAANGEIEILVSEETEIRGTVMVKPGNATLAALLRIDGYKVVFPETPRQIARNAEMKKTAEEAEASRQAKENKRKSQLIDRANYWLRKMGKPELTMDDPADRFEGWPEITIDHMVEDSIWPGGAENWGKKPSLFFRIFGRKGGPKQ